MAKIDRLLQRAIGFVKQGRLGEARPLLQAILHEQPHHQLAWGWYVQSFADEDERLQAFTEYLQHFPNDRRALQLQARLLRSQNQRWRQLANDTLHEIDVLQAEQHQARQQHVRLARQARLSLALVSLFLVTLLCLASVVALGKVDQLRAQLQALNLSYDQLNSRHNALASLYADLEGRHNALVVEHTGLQTQYESLTSQYSDLLSQYDSLRVDYDLLQTNFELLQGDYDWLAQIAVTPPYILTNGRNVSLAFEKLDGSLSYWQVPFDTLEYDLQRGNLARADIGRNLRSHSLYLHNTSTDESFYVIDVRPFVDAHYFNDVIAELYYQSAGDEAFIREVWNIVAQLTAYSSEIQDTPRYPLETLLAGGGDCEDTAILFASMLAAAPVDWQIQMVYMDLQHPTAPLETNHVAVYVITPQRSYLVETTSKFEMEPFSEGVRGWYFDID